MKIGRQVERSELGVKNMVSQKWIKGALIALVVLTSSIVNLINATEITNIDFAVLPGDKVEIRVSMDTPPPNFKEFTTLNPARIAMDFAGVTSSLKKKTQSVGVGVTRSITAVEAGNRTRLVVNLVEMTSYASRVDGNDLILTIGHGTQAVSASGGSTENSVYQTNDQQGEPQAMSSGKDISNIDFRRGESGEGRIVVQLENSNIGIDLRKEGRTVLAEFVDATIAEELIRKLDVIDFATPAKFISTSVIGSNVRIAIDTIGDEYEYLAYQADNAFIIELKPLTTEEIEQKKLREPIYTGERLSLNFQIIPVRSALTILSEFTNINMITSDTVSGSIALRLNQVPWDQALDLILKTKGLAKRQTGNVMLIAPAEEIAAREKLELETEDQIEKLAPLQSEFIQINYAKAEELSALILTKGAQYLSPRGSVAVHEKTNILIVQDTAKKLIQIRAMINRLDIPVRQVLIESRIVVADNGFSDDLGVRFGVSDLGGDGAISGNQAASDSLFFGGNLQNRSLAVNLPITDAAGTIGLTFARLVEGTILDVELSALESESRGEVIASPRVFTTNNNEAYIQSGEQIPYLQASSAGNTTITFKDAVLGLKVTPQITPDDRIILDLQINQDTRGEDTLFGPAINTREVGTRVLVDNGETIVLGGVYQQRVNRDVTKVPLLGDLPGIGALFRSTKESSSKQELLMFVTPKIVKDSLK
ncbi:MAG: type IV pilus assembly protein PilQ [Polaribacter sp.]|jgi:type IV pilus assembly protein PilQ